MVPPQTTEWFHPKLHTVFRAPSPPLECELSCTRCEVLCSLLGGGRSLSSLPLFLDVVGGQSWGIKILQPTSHSSWFGGEHMIQASPMEFLPRTFANAFEESAFSPKFTSYKDDVVLEPTVAISLPCAE